MSLLAIMVAALSLANAPADLCAAPEGLRAAAAKNAQSLVASAWTFTEGRPGAEEGPGWEVYAPLVMATIHTACPPATPAFAAALSKWQRSHRLRSDGLMSPGTAEELKADWNRHRRHVARAGGGDCLKSDPTRLIAVAPRDAWGKPEALSPGAYAAYRRMIDAARREAPEIFAGALDLKIVSAWRSPEADAAKCVDGGCSRVSMAPSCSAHWGGRAVDLNVGFIEGHNPADMDWQNRLYQTRQPAYRWLLKNAHRFGFANYFAEPWHWEWQGD